MKGFGKLHIKSAQSGVYKEPMHATHLTTFNFGQIVPALCYETIGKDRQNVKVNAFSRMSPLAKPTYGDFSLHTLSAFVPGFQLADDYEAWRVGKTTFEGSVPYGRYINMIDLVGFYTNYVFQGITPPSGSTADGKGRFLNSSGTVVGTYKWVITQSDGTLKYFTFRSAAGKYYFKVLCSLGYGLPSNVNLQITSAWYQYYNQSANYLSAFPLLAFAKVYNDWMSQSQRFNTSILSAFLRCVKHNRNYSGYNYSTRCLQAQGIAYILSSITLCFENDYFTSAWQKPNSPIQNLGNPESLSSFHVPGQTYNEDILNTVDDIVYQQDTNNIINYRATDLLNRVATYIRRRNYSGSKAVQQVFSELGIKPEDYKSNYSHIIDTNQYRVQVGDVMSMADTANAVLGSYAGKGIVGNTDNFKFHATDYGYLLYLAWYTVKPIYPYGFDRAVLRSDPRELYNAEFDGMSADAISVGEVATDPLRISSIQDFAVFGFTEKYNSYRCLRDKVTGDFLDFSPYGVMNTWHTARILGDIRDSGNLIAQSASFNTMPSDDSEFDRIFSYTNDNFDHFLTSFEFEITGSRPIKSLSEVVGLGVGDLTVSRNGNEIS